MRQALATAGLALLFSVGAAQAQTMEDPVLVSNTGQTPSGSSSSFGFDRAQGFTTGDNALGYTLTQADWRMNPMSEEGTEPTYTVELWSESSNRPGAKLATLTNPDRLTGGLNSFTATGAGIDLDAETTYFLVLDVSARARRINIPFVQTNNEDAGAASGWSIADGNFTRGFATTAWGNSPEASEMAIAIRGTVKTDTATDTTAPTLSSATVDGTTLTLTYNEALDENSTPAASAFTVTVASAAATVSMVEVTGSTVVLTLGSAVTSDQMVTVSYTVPTGTANKIQDTSSNAAGSITSMMVTVGALPALVFTDMGMNAITSFSVPESMPDMDGDPVDGTASYGVSLNSRPSGEVTVTINLTFATGQTAFVRQNKTTMRFRTGDWDVPQLLTLTATDDAIHNPGRMLTITHAASGGGFNGVMKNLTVTVTEDEAQPTVSLVLYPDTISENGGSTLVVPTLDLPSSVDTMVTVMAAPGTGATEADFTLSNRISLTIAAGTLMNVTPQGEIGVTAVDNNVDEPNKQVTISGTASNGNGVTGPADVTLTIRDNDTAGLVVSPRTLTVGENAGTGSYTVKLSTQPTADVTVTVTSSDTDAMTVSPASLTFTTTDWNTAKTVTVTGVNDDLENSGGSRSATARNSAAGYTTINQSVVVTISDDDAALPVINLSVSPDMVDENVATAQSVTVTATVSDSEEAPTADTAVTVSVAAGTAQDDDFAAVTDTITVTIPANMRTGTATFDFDPADDNVAEGDETVTVSGTATGYDVMPATLTITDDDTAPTVINLSVNPTAVGEEEAATSVTVTAAFPATGATLPADTEVTVSVAAGTGTNAASASDFATVDNFTVTIPAESLSGTATFSFDPTSDTDVEGDETVDVSGTTTTSGITITGTRLTITDDDSVPTVINLSVNPNMVNEDVATTQTVTVTATFPDSGTVSTATSVTVSVAGDTATAVTDFATVGNFTLMIPADTSSATATFMFNPTDDDVAEGDETVTVSGSATDFTVNSATLTITDDDTAPTVINLSVSPNMVDEDVAAATSVTVTAAFPATGAALPAATNVTVSVTGNTAGTADFTAVSNFNMTIPATMLSATTTFMFNPTDDDVAEGDETVTVGGAATDLTVNPATLTITDDDVHGVTVSPASLSVLEDGTGTYEVKLDTEPTGDVTVSVASSDTSVATVSPASLTFMPTDWSEAQMVTVSGVADDSNMDMDRATTITHSVSGADYDPSVRDPDISVASVMVTVGSVVRPTVSIMPPGPQLRLDANTALALSASGTDPDGGELSYSWAVTSAGGTDLTARTLVVDATDSTMATFSSNRIGAVTVTVTMTATASDGTTSTATASLSITVLASPTLGSLAVEHGPAGGALAAATLSPAFSPAVTDYDVLLPTTSGDVAFTATWPSGVTFAGGRTEPDGTTETFTLSNNTQSRRSLGDQGLHVFTFTMTLSGESTVYTVNVSKGSPPTVSLTPAADRTIYQDTSLMLTATGNDPDGDSISYAWTATDSDGNVVTSSVLSAADTATTSFSADTSDVYEVMVTATDGGGISASAGLTITVVPRPTVSLMPSDLQLRLDANTALALSASGTDPAGGALSYSWAVTDASGNDATSRTLVVDATDATMASFSSNRIGAHTVTVTATASDGFTTTASLSITVLPSPTLGSLAVEHGPAGGALAAASLSPAFSPAVTDYDVQLPATSGSVAFTATWPSGATFAGGRTRPDGTTATFTLSNGAQSRLSLGDQGLHVFTFTMTQGGDSMVYTVNVAKGLPPTVSLMPPGPQLRLDANTALALSASGTDPAGGALSYSWAVTSVGGTDLTARTLAVDATDATMATFSSNRIGAHTVTVTATASNGFTDTASLSISVVPSPTLGSLTVEHGPAGGALASAALSPAFSPAVTDYDVQLPTVSGSVAFTATWPSGASFAGGRTRPDGTTGTFTLSNGVRSRLTLGAQGLHVFTFTMTQGGESMVYTVNVANGFPMVELSLTGAPYVDKGTNLPLTAVAANHDDSYAWAVTDSDGADVTSTVLSSPTAMDTDITDNATVNFNAAAAGSYEVTVTVTSGADTASDSLTVMVTDDPVLGSLVIEYGTADTDDARILATPTPAFSPTTTSYSVTVPSGNSFLFFTATWASGLTFQGQHTDPDATALDFSLVSGTRKSQGIGSAPGDHSFAFTLRDMAMGGDSRVYTINVAVKADPTVTLAPAGDQVVTAGSSLALTATGTDPDGGNISYVWTVTDGSDADVTSSVLSGIGLDAMGRSTATFSTDTLGAYAVAMAVTDDEGETASAGLTLTVLVPPVVSLNLSPASITESGAGNASTVTASLDRTSSAATTVTVAAAGDVTLSANAVLTIAANATASTGTVTLTAVDDAVDAPDKTVSVSATAANSDGITGPDAVELTITDDEAAPTVTLALSADEISENGGAATVTASLDHASSEDTTITVSAAPGTNAAAGDFTLSDATTLTIAAGATSSTGTVSITAQDNDVAATNREVTVSATATNTQGVMATIASLTLTITEDDTAPSSIDLSLSPDTVAEDAGATSVTVTAALPADSGTLPTPTTVAVSVGVGTGDTAEAGDFAAVSNFNVTIAAGSHTGTGTFMFTPVNDTIAEGSETLSVSGTTTATGISTVNDATLTITDDETAPDTIVLMVSPNAVAEGAGATSVTVTAAFATGSVARETATAVTISVAANTATTADFEAVSNFTVTIAAAELSGSASFDFTPINDTLVEGSEAVTVSGAATGFTISDIQLGITDNDVRPTAINLTVNPTAVGEEDGATSVTVTAAFATSVSLLTDTEVTVSVAADTATETTDYAAVARRTVTILAGASSGTGTFMLTPVNDTIAEGDETITISGTTTATGISTVNDATLTITDDDTAPTAVNLVVVPNRVGEAAGATSLMVEASFPGSVSLPTSTAVTVSVAGNTATETTDFAAVADFTLVITAGTTSRTGTFMFTPENDTIAEGDETVTISGTTSAAGISTVNGDTLIITDNDTAPSAISLAVNPTAVAEAASATPVEVTASFPAGGTSRSTATEVAISVGIETGDTASTADFAAVTGVTVTIPANSLSGAATFMFDPEGDTLVEGAETLTVSGAATGFTITGAQLTINDDDTTPTTIALTVEPDMIGEESAATSLTVHADFPSGGATLTTPTEVTVSVGVETGDTATTADFAAVSDFTVTIPAGMTRGTDTFMFDPTSDMASEGSETLTVSGAATGFTVTSDQLTITDDDAPPDTINLTASPDMVDEDAGATTVTVTAAFPMGSTTRLTATDVTVSVAAGTATATTDFATVSDIMVTIAAGETEGTGTFTLTPMNDTVVEGDETLIISGTATGFTTINGDTLTINDDDVRPTTINLAVTPPAVDEATATAVTVTAAFPANSPTLLEDTIVTVSVAGDTATETTDFAAVADIMVTIAAGAREGTAPFTLTPVDDTIAEGDETLTVSGTTTAAGITTINDATLSITDDDDAPTTIALAVDPAMVDEAATATGVEVTASFPATGASRSVDTQVAISVGVGAGDTATTADFATVTGITVTIPAGALSGTGTFMFDPEDDTIVEGDETLTVSGTAAGFTVGDATLSITDDDDAADAITLTVTPLMVSEGAGATAVTVTAAYPVGSPTLLTPTAVTVSVAGATATETTDFAPVSNITVTIAAGETSGTGTFMLTPVNDTIAEGDETLTVSGMATDFMVSDATLTLTDNDMASDAINLTLEPNAVAEDAGGTSVAVTAAFPDGSPTLPTPTDVTVSVGVGTGDTAETDDFTTVTDFTVTIPAGMPSGTMAFTFTPTNDDVVEGSETLTVSGSATGFTTVNSATLSITDDDMAADAITLTLEPTMVGEEDGATDVEVTASFPVGSPTLLVGTDVTVSVAAGTATEGTDFAAVSDITVTIAAGETSGMGTFSFAPMSDTMSEGSETVAVSGTATNFTVTGATLTISDDDAPPDTINLSVAPPTVGEEDGATDVTVTAAFPPTSASVLEDVVVTVSVAGDSATATDDFTAVADFTVTITAGTTSGMHTFSFVPAGDTLAEGPETVTFSGSTTSAGITTINDATLTITDDDVRPGTINLTVTPSTLDEAAGATNVTVTAAFPANSAMLPTATDVIVSVAGNTATATDDFAPVSNITVRIPAGMPSGTGRFTLAPVDDALAEDPETLTVSGAATGFTVTAATLTLTDNDSPPDTVNLSVNPTSVGEADGATSVAVTATLPANSARLTEDAVVTVSLAGNTATATTDFAPVSDLTVTIPAGMPSGTASFTLTPVNDTLAEGPETLTVSGMSSVFTTVNSATLTLADDDMPPDVINLSVSPETVREDAGARPVTVTAAFPVGSAMLPTPTIVTISVAAGTATLADDFAAVADFTVTIAAGSRSGTDSFTFTPTNNTMSERNETVIVSGAATGFSTINPATLTIIDDDPGVTVRPTTLSVAEASGTGTYTVVLDTAPTADVTVTPMSSAMIIATVSGDLTFTTDNWDDPQTVTVTGVDNDIDHADHLTTTISHDVASRDDARYDGLDDDDVDTVAVTVTDDDTAGLNVSVAGELIELDEETPDRIYEVALNSEPTRNVTVMITNSNEAVATVDKTSLTFTASNWSTAQQVVVTATAPENEEAHGDVILTHEITSADIVYAAVSPVTVEVEVGVRRRALARIAQATKMTQPEFLRMAVNFAMEAITDRLAPGGREENGSTLGLAGRLLDASGLVNTGYLPQTGLLSQPGQPSQLQLLPDNGSGPAAPALPVGGPSTAGATPGHAASGGLALSRNLGESGVSAWISGGYRKQNGGDGDFLNWNGDAYHVHAGIDKPFGEAFIGGLSVGYVSGEFDYIDHSVGSAGGSGSIDTRITSVQPYLGWRPSDRLNLWGMVGYGDGEIEVRDDAIETLVSDASQRMLALGGRYRVRDDLSTLQVDVKAEVSAGRLKIDGNDDGIAASSVSASRWRLALEGTHEIVLDESCRLLPSFGLGARLDRGDGVTGTGVELNAGLDYRDTYSGLLVETDVRWLPAYSSSGSLKEWAASGAIRLLPHTSGRGLSFELSQSWGDISSGVERLWNDGTGRSWGDATEAGPRLETRLGYGMHGMGGLLTPYFGAKHEGGRASLMLGANWQRGRTSLNLRSEQLAEDGQDSGYSLILELSTSW